MTKKKREQAAPVQWLSEKSEWHKNNDPDFTYKIVDFYTKFKFKNITAGIGDHVLVSNADAAEPDSEEGCDVARLDKLYQSHDQELQDKYRARVTWYSPTCNLPKAVTISSAPEHREVVEDHRPFDVDVSIETFFRKCEVIKMPTTTVLEEVALNLSKALPTFICRYRLMSQKRQLILEPILEDERADFQPIIPNILKTPKRKGSENAKAKTPNSLIAKFAMASLDGKWMIKNSDSNKVTLMRDITNSYDQTPTPKRDASKRKSTLHNTDTDVSPKKIASVTKNTHQNYMDDYLSKSAKRTLNFNAETPTKDDETTSRRRTSRAIKPNLKYEQSDDEEKIKVATPIKKKLTEDKPYTPKKLVLKSDSSDSEDDFVPKTPKRGKSVLGTPKGTPRSIRGTPKSMRINQLTPSIKARENPVILQEGGLELARERLHVSAVPLSLPCREEEFNNIFTFLETKIKDNSGGCMYVSGVPGTGKTATVSEVVRCLHKQVRRQLLPDFHFLEINGMRLTEPRQAYVHIYRQLTGKTVAWEQACKLLEQRFTKPAPRRSTVLLLVDELDVLCTRRQDVLYNLLDWPSKTAARLAVVAIANTMDLPERLLASRVASRLGLTRLTFQPYTHVQLQSIVSARLLDTGAFNSDAVQLVARKVAAVSGDARRALDVCRRAVELAGKGGKVGKGVGLAEVNTALAEMIASPRVRAVQACSETEKLFLQATAAEVQRSGIEETTFKLVLLQLFTLSVFNGCRAPTVTEALGACSRLSASRLLLTASQNNQDIHQKIMLNVSADDIHYAMQTINSV